jgi:hypothetical protein
VGEGKEERPPPAPPKEGRAYRAVGRIMEETNNKIIV